MTTRTLPFQRLSDRHQGVSPGLSSSYEEAACVCLDRHHASPAEILIVDQDTSESAALSWTASDARAQNAWANKDDTTEVGAYCLALANAELTRGLVAVSRAQGRTGVDYYLGPAGSTPEDLEATTRLEVSGTDEGNVAVIRARLRQKVEQAGRVDSNLPALATVVGFAALRIESTDVKK